MRSTIIFAALMLPALAHAADAPADLAAAFGAREGVVSASLSPDGTKIALVASAPGQGSRAYVVDAKLGAEPKPILIASGKPENIQECKWVAATRLVCEIGGLLPFEDTIIGFSSIVGVDADGGNQKVLSTRRGENALGFDTRGGHVLDYLPNDDGVVLMARSYVAEERTGSLISKSAQGMGVDRIDTRTGAPTRVETAQPDAEDYITDGFGTVRIKAVTGRESGSYDTGQIKYLYRMAGSREWQTLSVRNLLERSGFVPVFVDRDKDVAYGYDKVDGRLTLVAYTLGEAPTRTVVFQHPKVDVAGLMVVGRRQRVVGVSYVTDKREAVFFDPVIKGLVAALSKTLGGRQVYVTDASADEKRLLLWAGSDTDPGQFYLFDRAAKTLSPIIAQRPQLQNRPLATVTPITYPAADGTMIPAYLTLPLGVDPKNCPRSSCRTAGRARATNGASTGSRNISSRAALRSFNPNFADRRVMETPGFRRTVFNRGERRSATSSTQANTWLPRASPTGPIDDSRLVVRRLCGIAGGSDRARPV